MDPVTQADRFPPIAPLGEGAMGHVWRVMDMARGHEVALKTLRLSADATPKSALRMKQEFHWMTQLRHPNCCEVYDYGTNDAGEPYFTMEVVPGQGLDELLPMPVNEVPGVIAQLLLALAHVHQRGFVHRDVKGANVRRQLDGVVKLMDFGLMGVAGQTGPEISGTPAYMAPEAIRRGPLDRRADLYAVGVLAYELLTGQPPFAYSTTRELLQAHLTERPEAPSRRNPLINASLESVVMRLLEKDPVARFSSAAQALAALGTEVPQGLGGTLLSSPLIGRELESGLMRSYIEALGRVKPSGSLLLVGAPGMGKSRLANEFRVAAQLADVPCAAGAYQSGGQVAFPAMAAIVRGLLPAIRAYVPGALEAGAPVLEKLIPELSGLQRGPAVELETEERERDRLQRVMVDLFCALADVKPFVMILEDLQWADAWSLELLGEVVKSSALHPFAVLLSTRELPDVASEWGQHVTVRSLSGLDPTAVAQMVGEMLGSKAIDGKLAGLVAEATGGNPFYVERLLDYMVRHGQLVHDGDSWQERASGNDLPSSLLALLLGNLDDLPPDGLAVCQAIAVAGGELALDALGPVTELMDEELLDAMLDLQTRGVLVPVSDGRGRFAHEQFRFSIDSALEPWQRLSLHGKVAASLASTLQDIPIEQEPLELLTAISHHALISGNITLGVPATLAAAKRHMAVFASEEARVYLRAGIVAVDASPSSVWDTYRLELLRLNAQLMLFVGDPAAAQVSLERAAEIASESRNAPQAAEIAGLLARVALALNEPEKACAQCDRALELAAAAKDNLASALALLTRAKGHAALGRAALAIADATQALDLSRTAGAAAAEGQAMAALGQLIFASEPKLAHIAIGHLEAAIERFFADTEKVALAQVYGELGWTNELAGDFDAADAAYGLQLATGLEVGHQEGYVRSLAALADLALTRGNSFQAVRMLEDARRESAPGPKAICAAVQARQAAWMGNLKLAFEELESLALPTLRAAEGRFAAQVAVSRLETCLLIGHLEGASLAAEELKTMVDTGGQHWCKARLQIRTAEIALQRGALVEAALELGQVRPVLPVDHLARFEVESLAALSREDWSLALKMAQEGRALATKLGVVLQQGRLAGLAGEAALALGDAVSAAGHFKALQEIAVALDVPLLLAQALFGVAASVPYADSAAGAASEAYRVLGVATTGLMEADSEMFWRLPANARIRQGSYYAFGLPRSRPRGTQPLKPETGVFREMW